MLPLPIQVTRLNKEEQDLLEKNLEEAFLFLSKDKKQEEIDAGEFVSVMNAATERFLKKLENKRAENTPRLLVPSHIVTRD